MEASDIQPLISTYHRKLAHTQLTFKRYLHDRINWDVQLLGIKGARGTGKTTLLLQHIKEVFPNPEDALYVSLDNLWFNQYKLEDLVAYCYVHGIRSLFLDEVHRHPDWSLLLKNFVDSYPELKIVYTGSAMLAIDHSVADLSRRQTLYTLHELSFREFLRYEGLAQMEALSLEEVLANPLPYTLDLTARLPVLKYFEAYLDHGAYPYYKESVADYPLRVSEVARLVIESDIPALEAVSFPTLAKMKQLLMIIAHTVPMEVNINKLTTQLETTRDQCLKMLYLMEKAGLLLLLTKKVRDYKHLAGPKKIYLHNTNLMAALNPKNDPGMRRETFLANQLGTQGTLTLPPQGDFLLNGQTLFEVGGAHKTFSQIADIPHSYLALDGIETGTGARIPLWLFGMMY